MIRPFLGAAILMAALILLVTSGPIAADAPEVAEAAVACMTLSNGGCMNQNCDGACAKVMVYKGESIITKCFCTEILVPDHAVVQVEEGAPVFFLCEDDCSLGHATHNAGLPDELQEKRRELIEWARTSGATAFATPN